MSTITFVRNHGRAVTPQRRFLRRDQENARSSLRPRRRSRRGRSYSRVHDVCRQAQAAGSGSTSSSISLVLLNGATEAHFGAQVTFRAPHTATTGPWVNLRCYQNGRPGLQPVARVLPVLHLGPGLHTRPDAVVAERGCHCNARLIKLRAGRPRSRRRRFSRTPRSRSRAERARAARRPLSPFALALSPPREWGFPDRRW